MPTYPRYLTFPAGELEARLRALDRTTHETPPGGVPLRAAATGTSSGRRILVKSHSCPVCFPDRIPGRCRYTRGGPAFHVFLFEHGGEGTGFPAAALPAVYWTRALPVNDRAAIEAKARELADEAYRRAADRERRDYFARASENSGRRKRPDRYRMTAKRAKEIGGKYALCFRTGTGDGLIPIAPSRETLEEANAAWREKRDPRTVVGCCNRLDRCWGLPRFNPLYAEFDPRPQAQAQAQAAPNAVPRHERGAADGDDWEYLPGPDDPDDGDDGDGISDAPVHASGEEEEETR